MTFSDPNSDSVSEDARPMLYVLDGHSLAYRAFYALPDSMGTADGQITNAVYGFTTMLLRLLTENPDGFCVTWDMPGPTFRNEIDEGYKATRSQAPSLFVSQLPLIRQVLSALRIPQFENTNYEADDLLATIADKAAKGGWDVTIVTGDRDAFQLASDNITIRWTRRGVTDTVDATPQWVFERYGMSPQMYMQLAALRGDPSDNLPGVPGVGEKTAVKLLTAYGDIDGIYNNLDDLTPKLRENLIASRERVALNLGLTILHRDVPNMPEPDSLKRKDPIQGELIDLFGMLEFDRLLDRVPGYLSPNQPLF